MPDLLTHILAAYVVATVAARATGRISPRTVPIVMAGAGIPDLSKMYLIVSAEAVESVTGVPFSWVAIHRLGPVVAIAGITAACFARRVRRRVFGGLLFGAATHFVLDLGVKRASGAAPPYLFPLSWWHPPSADLYLSSDVWPTLLAVAAAISVWYVDYRGLSLDDSR